MKSFMYGDQGILTFEKTPKGGEGVALWTAEDMVYRKRRNSLRWLCTGSETRVQ